MSKIKDQIITDELLKMIELDRLYIEIEKIDKLLRSSLLPSGGDLGGMRKDFKSKKYEII